MTVILGNSTSMRPYGILRNVMICIGPHMYPIDLMVMDITRDHFYPIIFGKPFTTLTNASINSKKNTISLKFGHDLLRFNFSSFKKHFYHKKPGDVKGKTINDCVSDFFGVPHDAIERSILEFDKCPNDEEKEESLLFLILRNMRYLEGKEKKSNHRWSLDPYQVN